MQSITYEGPLFLEEDAVAFCSGKSVKCGKVVESYADFDSGDSSLSSGDDADLIKPGKVRVAFYPSGQEILVDERKLQLIERSLMPGDITRRISSHSNKMGYVTECRVMCHLQIKGTNQIISKVDSQLLTDVYLYGNESIYVELDGWIGRTHERKFYDVIIEFQDGARCTVDHAVLDEFEDLNDTMLRKKQDSVYISECHYRGQRLKGPVTSLISTSTRWIKTSKQFGPKISKSQKRKTVVVSVVDIEISKLHVQWLFHGLSSSASEFSPPDKEVVGSQIPRLRLIDPFAHCTAQIGDTFYYRVQPSDKIEVITPQGKHCVSQYLLPRIMTGFEGLVIKMAEDGEKVSADKQVNDDSDEIPDEDIVASTGNLQAGDVPADEWEDIDSPHSNPKGQKTRHGRKLKRRVLSTNSSKTKENYLTTVNVRPGDEVPVEIVLSESFVDVMWQDGTEEKGISSRDLYSVYHLDDNEFFPGDYVVKADSEASIPEEYGVIISVDHAQRIANVRWFYSSAGVGLPTNVIQATDVSVYELKDHPNYRFRPGAAVLRIQCDTREEMECCDTDVIGSVIRLHGDGLMSIKWADECISHCYPEQLFLVANMHESDDEYDDDSDSSDSDSDSLSSSGESSTDESDPEGDNDDEQVDALLKNFGETMTDVLDSYHRVLASVQEIRQSRTVMSWKDFEKIMLPINKVAGVYKKMKRLDESLRTELYRIDFQAMQVSIKKAKLYSQLCANFDIIKGEIEEHGRINETIWTLLDYQMEIIKDWKEPLELLTLICLPFSKLLNFINFSSFHGGDDSSDDSWKSGLVAKTTKIQNFLNEVSVKYSSEDTTPVSLQDFLKALDHVDKLMREESQLEIADKICEFFSSMKDITVNILEAYNSQYVKSELNTSNNCAVESAEEDMSEQKLLKSTESKGEVCCDNQVKEVEKIVNEIKMEMTDNEDAPFKIHDFCPSCHKFFSKPKLMYSPKFIKSVKVQMDMLNSNLPHGVIVRGYEDRLDCFSAMITGPSLTPYEDALFIFDIHLPADYPQRPPTLHYHSYASERLNPNLYVDGTVCVSLLGTWTGKEQELWNPKTSNLLQVLVSIQGLILVKEPYFNEAGFEKQRGTSEGAENSKKYNEMVCLKTLESIVKMIGRPHESFKTEIQKHWKLHGQRYLTRISRLLESTIDADGAHENLGYPLLPLSRGCVLALQPVLDKFKQVLANF